ncbi:ATP-binding protein [Corynebacterium comes]|uniref:Chromosome segregation protein n=1 Tax=Corynebacterium comes TaxID=2675218 RepID=A0A6B8WBW3_9CORY|nr:ATP-binding protein [Corynebacterium comes]QGU04318.1 chromosome segregation protein [Corynebacterium comes]
MRIHSLTIDNVRGIEHLELHGLPETGVIVIHGDNEQGKSTIMDALNVVLHQKHGAQNKVTKPLRPVHRDVSPSVSLTATMGPVTFTIEKTWFRGKSARLTITSPQRDTFTGDQAEARLDEIKNDHLDADLLHTLFLRQDDPGGSVDTVGISSLTRALDSASGTEGAPGTEDTGLIAAVEKEYTRYFTAGTGKETDELKTARADVEAAETERAEAHARAVELESFVQSHDRAVSERDRARTELPAAVSEEAELAEKARLAAEADARAGRLREELERAEGNLERANGAVEQRQSLVDAVTAAAADLDRRREGIEETTAAAAHEEAQLTELGAQVKAAQIRQREAGERLRAARATRRLVEAAARRDELAAQLEKVSDLNERIRELRERAASRQVTDQDVRAVEEAAGEVTIQRRLREQAAAKLQLTSASATTVSVDGQPLDVASEGVAVELRDGTEVTIGEITARYVAGFSDSVTGEDQVAAAEMKLGDLLAELDCEDPDAVRAARDAAREISDELSSLTRDRTTLLSGEDPESLAAEHARLAGELADADLPSDLDTAAAAAQVREAEEAQDSAGEEVTTLDATLTPWRDRKARLALTELTTRIEAAEVALNLAEENLAAAEKKGSVADLAADVEKARDARLAAAERLRLAEAEVAAADPKLAKSLHEGAVARVESLRGATSRADTQLAELKGRIEMATGAAERLEKAEAALEAARRRLDSVDRRAQAVRLLRETLHRHRDVVRARYAQPFADQLGRLARTVFGHDVEFTLSEGLEVTKRSIGDNTVPLEDLSGGAKEQLAILTRFAIAGLVSQDSGDGQVPVPVVVDDSLGSTDPSRLQLMSTLFTEMGKNSQVIVLTCVPQRYERVVGRTEYPIAELKSTGMLL